jgi:hypothetical protein
MSTTEGTYFLLMPEGSQSHCLFWYMPFVNHDLLSDSSIHKIEASETLFLKQTAEFSKL